ncbi:MAG: PIN domain-containing protein, partial [Thermomicrobiales bacterium]
MLDTNIVSYVVKQRYASVRERLDTLDPSLVCLSVITQSELLYGLNDLPHDHSLRYRIPRFLESVPCVSWDSAAVEVHASLRYRLVRTGQVIGEMD